MGEPDTPSQATASPTKEDTLHMLISRLRDRISQSDRQGGFTLIELLVVIIIIGILLAIAIPSYLGFRDRANNSAAQANVRAAVPAVEAYFADNGTYAGMTLTGLRASYDQAIKGITIVSSSSSTYCVRGTSGSKDFYKNGPGGDITATVCT
jgi:prepilin-type N-terminal cleavage/methylation domain-containing protein